VNTLPRSTDVHPRHHIAVKEIGHLSFFLPQSSFIVYPSIFHCSCHGFNFSGCNFGFVLISLYPFLSHIKVSEKLGSYIYVVIVMCFWTFGCLKNMFIRRVTFETLNTSAFISFSLHMSHRIRGTESIDLSYYFIVYHYFTSCQFSVAKCEQVLISEN
jgi:hypothetical protein